MALLKKYWEVPAFVLFALIFVTFPELDLWFTSLFYVEGEGFPLNENPVVQVVYVIFRYIPALLIPVMLLMLAAPWFIKKLQGTRKYTTFLLLVLLIGPGIIVHPVLKDNWDRPRPRDVQEFGGQFQFQPAFIPSENGGRHKSFASGHGAMGFYFIAFAWVFRKRRWFAAGLVIGAIVSMGRIVQGGHFFSDVATAGFIVYFTSQVLSHWLLGHRRINESKEA
jgi:lipid A 4'-phosphatase